MTKDKGPSGHPLEDWHHRAADVPERGLEVVREANVDERTKLAAALDIQDCQVLTVSYRLRPAAGGRYRLTGSIEAVVTQACIISLEPVVSEIREPIEEEFWPPEAIVAPDQGEAGEQDALSHEAPEPIEDGEIRVGRVVYEQIAAALDPYPRRADAVFAWQEAPEAGGAEAGRDNPFAALARLKDKT